jgi:hypothetical protein
MTIIQGCANCGDRCGWRIWQSQEFSSGKVEYVWVKCMDCNAEGLKPQPELCQKCGDTPGACKCNSLPNMD